MLRYCVVVLDSSIAMMATDLQPTRLSATCSALTKFTHEWFDQNPVGSMALVAIRSNVSHTLSPLTSIPRHLTEALSSLGGLQQAAVAADGTPTQPAMAPAVAAMADGGPIMVGSFSMQSALDSAAHELSLVPTAGHKEVLLVHAALSSVDAGDVMSSIGGLVDKGITVHVIGLAGEVYIAKRTTEVRSRNELALCKPGQW